VSAAPPASAAAPVNAPARRRRPVQRAVRWAGRRWSLTIGLAAVAALCCAALGAGWLAGQPPDVQHMDATLQPPFGRHLLGTDEYGRDVLSRMLFGARLTLLASTAAVLLAAVTGSALGLTTGYFGGAYDSLAGRMIDVLFAFPVVLLGIAIVAVLGPGEPSVVLAIAAASLPNFARVSRSAIIAEREREYVMAAHAIGAPVPYIIVRTLLPNLIGPLIVLVSLGFAYAVLYEASFSFLGLGAQPPTPEWGVMLSSARSYLFQAPWYAFFPGAAIFVLVFSLNLVGDGLRDLLDPRRPTSGRPP
jgi:ABC-type dipeptide/oligopeptide/nickel transport system permease subunit